MPASALRKLLLKLDALDSVQGIVILRDGQVVCQANWAPFDLETKRVLHSLSKSFVSLAIGFAQQERRLKVTDKLVDFFPEYAGEVTDEKMRDVTLEHLLTMTSGHQLCAMSFLSGRKDGNWERGFLASGLDFEPGTHFTYNSAATYMLAAVIKRMTGENPREYLMPRLFDPLDITPGLWECSATGVNCGGWGLMLSTTDLAKVVHCLCANGMHRGRQLIPADYLATATRKHSDNSGNGAPDWCCGYGYQFWCSQHGYRGDGASGQYMLVIPEYRLGVAMNASIPNMQEVLSYFWDFLPEISSGPLPQNPEEDSRLQELIEGFRYRALLNGLSTPGVSPAILHQQYQRGATLCRLDVSSRECTLTFQKQGGLQESERKDHGWRHQEQLRASLVNPSGCSSWLLLDDDRPHLYHATAHWKDPHTLLITAVSQDTGWHDFYTVTTGPEGAVARQSRFVLPFRCNHLVWPDFH